MHLIVWRANGLKIPMLFVTATLSHRRLLNKSHSSSPVRPAAPAKTSLLDRILTRLPSSLLIEVLFHGIVNYNEENPYSLI